MRRHVGTALLAALVLTACSDDQDPPTTTVPTTPPTDAAPPPSTEPVSTTEPLIGAIDGPVSIDTAVRASEAP